MQLSWEDEVALVDPLAVDIAPLGGLLAGDVVTIIHAASQDLEVLIHACGSLPSTLWDTQIAAGFLGMSTPSLASLLDRELSVKLPKGDRLTDWLGRPLTEGQLAYAASDVDHLLALHDRQHDRLVDRGRLDWVVDECALELAQALDRRVPDQAWTKVKEARRLQGREAAIAQSVAAWREQRAAERDRPVRRILSDLAIVSIAHKAPTSRKALAGLRGVDEGVARGMVGESLLEAVELGRTAEPPVVDRAGELPRDLRPAGTLASAWVSQRARDHELDPALLATRADVEALLMGRTDTPLSQGWRADLIGDAVRRLLEGDASVAFEGRGRLVLEERSRRPIEGDEPSPAPGPAANR